MEYSQKVRQISAVLCSVMALPLLTQVFAEGPGLYAAELVSIASEDIESIRERARNDRATQRMQGRAYHRAVERCEERRADGEDVDCPNRNDPSFQIRKPSAPEPAGIPEDGVVPAVEAAGSVSINELTTTERTKLRTYTRAGFCSKAAGVMLFNLCLEILGNNASGVSPTGLKNDQIRARTRHGRKPPTLRSRLEVLDESISGSGATQQRGVQPLRFQGGLND